jgi:hypothetical protein
MAMNKLAAFVFPPNWSACVSGPHLAVPLLASVARNSFWDAVCCDLSAAYYNSIATAPDAISLKRAVSRRDFAQLDDLYFEWEDQYQGLVHSPATSFGLLSGFDFEELGARPLAEVDSVIRRDGTIFDGFYRRVALPKLLELKPTVIGVTVGSMKTFHMKNGRCRFMTALDFKISREALPYRTYQRADAIGVDVISVQSPPVGASVDMPGAFPLIS